MSALYSLMPFSEKQILCTLKVWKRMSLGFFWICFLFICIKKEVTSKVLSVAAVRNALSPKYFTESQNHTQNHRMVCIGWDLEGLSSSAPKVARGFHHPHTSHSWISTEIVKIGILNPNLFSLHCTL